MTDEVFVRAFVVIHYPEDDDPLIYLVKGKKETIDVFVKMQQNKEGRNAFRTLMFEMSEYDFTTTSERPLDYQRDLVETVEDSFFDADHNVFVDFFGDRYEELFSKGCWTVEEITGIYCPEQKIEDDVSYMTSKTNLIYAMGPAYLLIMPAIEF